MNRSEKIKTEIENIKNEDNFTYLKKFLKKTLTYILSLILHMMIYHIILIDKIFLEQFCIITNLKLEPSKLIL